MSCVYQNRLEHIADYVRGVLPENEQETFEAHYLGCDECLDAVRFMEKTAVAMRHYGADIFTPARSTWLDNLKTWWDKLPLSQQWKAVIPAFATYLLIIGVLTVGYRWFRQMTDQPSSSHATDATMSEQAAIRLSQTAALQHLDWTISETADTALYNRLAAIQPLYQNHQYSLAAEHLAKVVQDFPQSIDARLFLGITQLQNHQVAEAMANFNGVLKSKSEHDAALWYLAQGYILQNKFVEARQPLAALVKQKYSRYYHYAVDCLEKLSVLKK